MNVCSERKKKASTPAAAIAANAGSISSGLRAIGPELELEGVRGVVQDLGIVTVSRVERVAEHANSGDVRRRLLQDLQALLLLVSTIERQARDVAGRANHVTD